jgi:hypothetical protein
VSLSTTLQYAQAFPVSAPQPIRVVDYLPGQPNDRFIDDNFGTFYQSYGIWPIRPNLMDVVKPLGIASEDVLSASRLASGPTELQWRRVRSVNRLGTKGLVSLRSENPAEAGTGEQFTRRF